MTVISSIPYGGSVVLATLKSLISSFGKKYIVSHYDCESREATNLGSSGLTSLFSATAEKKKKEEGDRLRRRAEM
jgi:hypothetical protein